MNNDFTRVECSECGIVYSVFNTIDDERFQIQHCTYCGSEDVDTYLEVVRED